MAQWLCNTCLSVFDSSRKRRICPDCRDEADKDRHRDYRQELRTEFLNAYGNKCQCPCGCSCDTPGFLGLGHKDNSGAKHRKMVGGGGYITYKHLKEHNWPKDKYRLECWNCNFSKRLLNGKCALEKNARTSET